MKKVIYLSLLCFILTSCLNDDRIENQSSETLLENFTGSEIAIEDKGKVSLNFSDEIIMNSFKKFNSKMELGLEPERFEVINIDNKNYLRFYSKKKQVSTIALVQLDNKRIVLGETVCTSIACATGGGCIPDGSYCTKCRPEGTPVNAPD